MKCVHCFKNLELDKKSKDHVFPASWYTNDTPSEVQRWTVSSCKNCNLSFGKLEQKLFVQLVPCIDPNKAEASGITNKLMKTLKKRPHFLRKLLSELKPYSKNIEPFPGLGYHFDFPIESQLHIQISSNLLMTVLGKIFRGIEYKIGKQYIEDPYELEIYHVNKEPEIVKNLFQKHGKTKFLGPGFKVERAVPFDETRPVIYKVTTWGTIISYASIDIKKTV